MKRAIGWIALLLTLMTLFSAVAETENGVAFRLNGEPVYQADIDAAVSDLTRSMSQYGLDVTDAEIAGVIAQVAQKQLMDDILLAQDMTAQGMYIFTQEDETAIQAAVEAAQKALLAEYAVYYAEQTEDEAELKAALEADGYTATALENYYRNAMASERYEAWLIRDEPPIGDEELQATYQQRVSESKSLYAQDVAAFETALASGQQAWYRPGGYRAVLQIMMSAQGETDEQRLAAVAERTEAIYTRLEDGEPFESLIAEYGEDSAFANADFAKTGYQVHAESILWEDAFVAAVFSDELSQPGDVSQPVVFGGNVHILYYLKDVDAGAVELTDALAQALRTELIYERADARMSERLEELNAQAELVYPGNE